MIAEMKVFLLFVLMVTTPISFAEGVASMTMVTAENGKRLDYHGLAVICKSSNGKTFVDLVFRPQKETPFTGCSLAIYSEDGERTLLRIEPVIRRASRIKGLPEGSRVSFHVADELVDQVEMRYHLHANDFQSHVFTIKKGELGKLAKLPQ